MQLSQLSYLKLKKMHEIGFTPPNRVFWSSKLIKTIKVDPTNQPTELIDLIRLMFFLFKVYKPPPPLPIPFTLIVFPFELDERKCL